MNQRPETLCLLIAFLAMAAGAAEAQSGGNVYQQSSVDGTVVFEAETPRSATTAGGHQWQAVTTPAGFVGGALAALPDNGASVTVANLSTSPCLSFRVDFVRTGSHYFWVRGRSPGTAGDSLHVGLDGACPTTGNNLDRFASTAWTWRNLTADSSGTQRATIDVTTRGLHTVNLWMREDGLLVDRVLIVHTAAYFTDGATSAGPAVSAIVSDPTPPAPAGLTATAGDAQVDLAWNAVAGGTITYNVKRSTTSGGPYTNIVTGVSPTNYLDTTAVNGTTYYYVVTAVNTYSAGGGNSTAESAPSNQVSATPLPPPPGVFTLTAAGNNTFVDLSWTASPNATSYTVMSSTISGGPYTPVATGVTGLSYRDSGLPNHVTFYYIVTAVNVAGTTDSNEASATTVPRANDHEEGILGCQSTIRSKPGGWILLLAVGCLFLTLRRGSPERRN